ncbi:MAG: hypothetical protein A3J54_00565 [Candidatus Ryanbacteria bacterium RIFCSPHIGHO2_02_FULL_45_13b]|uniref:PilN domain-containing protein n=1 Tax=Candidatus Ryanbacteria bacterium RIFCSPHIGHO2_02_FULL_45_13b TaxID=1802117 RepID=A0A1G2G8U9_9BACT|nr:MAG: hypothetical protein A3J54_00565 [Candidatus Ryanbacteria bacterium RIFCSPHIGHO2_02_FULL_45_13b]
MADPSLIAKPRMEYARPPRQSGGGLGILVIIAILFLVGVGGVYGGAYVYRQNAEESLDGFTRELSDLEKNLDTKNIQEMARVDRGLRTARSLLAAHIHSSNLFSLLEDHTLADVHYTTFAYTFEGGVSLGGRAKDFLALHRQLSEFRAFPLITAVTLKNITLVDDKAGSGIDFVINITLAENVFRFR